jgi:hypothetical protein
MTNEPQDIIADARRHQITQKVIAKQINESTKWTWLWSILFGPIYFWVHGFVGAGFLAVLIGFMTIGFGIVTFPFIAYSAWRRKAEAKAEMMQIMRRN